MSINMSIPKMNIGSLKYSGVITATEKVIGDIEFALESSKCTSDLKTCEKYATVNFREMCKRFQEKNRFYSGLFENIKPPLSCPIQPGNYSIEEASIDLTPVSFVPLDGFTWLVTFKFVSSTKGSKVKKTVLCLNSETKIYRTNKQSLA